MVDVLPAHDHESSSSSSSVGAHVPVGSSLMAMAWDTIQQRWRPVIHDAASISKDKDITDTKACNDASSSSVAASAIASLTIVTWNIDKDDTSVAVRAPHIMTVLASCNADIICLQEMTVTLLQVLLHQPWLQSTYIISDASGVSLHGHGHGHDYGEVILVRRTHASIIVHAFTIYGLPSVMNRRLLIARITVNGVPLMIATTHLESMSDTAPLRKKQLGIIFPLLAASGVHTIFCGDFNLCSSTKENAIIVAQSSYIDLWPTLYATHSDDTQRTGWTQPYRGRFKAWRPDRILIRSAPLAATASAVAAIAAAVPAANWLSPATARLIGTTPIDSKSSPSSSSSSHSSTVPIATATATPTRTVAPAKNWTLPPEVAAMVAANRAKITTGFFPSDHYGIVATLTVAPSVAVAVTL